MRSSACMLVFGVLLLWSVPASSSDTPPTGDSGRPVDEARSEASAAFQLGVELFHEGNFPAALVEFQKAYRLLPSHRVLYNISQTFGELHDYVHALTTLEQYLEEGKDEISDARRGEVNESIRKLRARIGALTISVNVDGAEIRIDDSLVGTSPLGEAVAVNPGTRRVSVFKKGFGTDTRVVMIAGGEKVSVSVEITKLGVAKRAPLLEKGGLVPGVGDRTPSRSRLSAGAWISLSATAGLAVAAGVCGALTLDAQRAFDRRLETFGSTRSQVDEERDTMKRYALMTDVFMGATLIAASSAVYFMLIQNDDSSRQDHRGFSLRLSPAPTGMTVSGRW